MANTSEVDAALDAITEEIEANRALAAQVESILITIGNKLGAIPTTYADVKTTVEAFTPTGAWESLSKDRLAKQVTQFSAFDTAVSAALAEIQGV